MMDVFSPSSSLAAANGRPLFSLKLMVVSITQLSSLSWDILLPSIVSR